MMLEMVDVYIEQAKFTESLKEKSEIYQQALKLAPHHSNLIFYAVRCFKELKDWNRAIQCYEALESKNQSSHTCIELAGLYYLTGNWDKLDEKLVEYLALKPQEYQKSDYVDETIDYLEKARQFNPSEWVYHYYLGKTFTDSAAMLSHSGLGALKKANQLDPTQLSVIEALSLQYYWADDLASNLKLLKRSLNYLPNESKIYYLIGQAYGGTCGCENKADLPKGVAAYEKAITLDPNQPEYYRALGHFLNYEKIDYLRSVEMYEKAVNLKPNDFDLQVDLGRAATDANQLEYALETLLKAETIRPADNIFSDMVYHYIADIYQAKGDFEQTITYEMKYFELDPPPSNASKWLAKRYMAFEKWNEAIDYYNEALQPSAFGCHLLPTEAQWILQSDTYLPLIQAYAMTGNWDKALGLVNQAESIGCPDADGIRAGLEKLRNQHP